jgi:hypothetical protein
VQAEDAAKTVKRFGNVEQSLHGGMQFYADLQVALLLGWQLKLALLQPSAVGTLRSQYIQGL